MSNIATGFLALLLLVPSSMNQPTDPAARYKALMKEFNAAARGLYEAKNDADRAKVVARGEKLPRQFLQLAEAHPKDPIALDALVQAVNQQLWLENNTTHPGFGASSPQVRALAILTHDYARSDKIADACWRTQYGFRPECETFLRTVLAKNPHRDMQGQACLRLAFFLHGRMQRTDLLRDRPDMAKRYEGLFGKEYLTALQRRDRGDAIKEIEALFERGVKEFGDVKTRYGGTVAEQAQRTLFDMRHLSVGKMAPDIDGVDQDGKRFKLSDYRGKVVLLYFWSEY